MKLSIFAFVIAFSNISLSLHHERISKVICSLSIYKNIDILTHDSFDPIKLSKSLVQECDIRFRVIPIVSDISKNFIAFTDSQKSHKVKF